METILGKGYKQTLEKFKISEEKALAYVEEVQKMGKDIPVMNNRGINPAALEMVRKKKQKKNIHDMELAIVAKMVFDTMDMNEEGKKTMPKGKNATDGIMTAGKKGKETVPYTVRLEKDVAKRWRTYTELGKYGDKSTLTEAALTEYMERHKLSPELQKKFDTLMEL